MQSNIARKIKVPEKDDEDTFLGALLVENEAYAARIKELEYKLYTDTVNKVWEMKIQRLHEKYKAYKEYFDSRETRRARALIFADKKFPHFIRDIKHMLDIAIYDI